MQFVSCDWPRPSLLGTFCFSFLPFVPLVFDKLQCLMDGSIVRLLMDYQCPIHIPWYHSNRLLPLVVADSASSFYDPKINSKRFQGYKSFKVPNAGMHDLSQAFVVLSGILTSYSEKIQILRLILQIAKAVKTIQNQGFVHLDIHVSVTFIFLFNFIRVQFFKLFLIVLAK